MSMSFDSANKYSVMGGMNYHILINFVDGVTWLCCVRWQNTTSTPIAHQNLLIKSEVAT
jgi:hypothetical protein